MTISYNTVKIDGVEYPLVPGSRPNESATDRFPGKVTIGDYSLDSNDLLSAWVFSDGTGGHGVLELQEGVTDTRYRFSTIYTRYPKQFTKPFNITTDALTASTGAVRPLCDLYYTSLWFRYLQQGTQLVEQTGPTTLGTARGAMTGAATDKGVVFTGLAAVQVVYVPQGVNGYSAFDKTGPTLRNVTAAELMVSFLAWDDKLIGIDTSGQIYYATTATAAANTTFTSYGATGKLDPSFTPKKLHAYYNRANDLTIFVVSDRGVWAFDPATPRLYRVPQFESVHPRFGESSCVWNSNLYVSSGMDILEFNGSVVRNIGLSRDEGIPFDYQGRVVDLVGGQNGLYAIVEGSGTRMSVHEMSPATNAWFCIDTNGLSNATPAVPTTAMVSLLGTAGARGYQLVWGFGTDTYKAQDLPVSFTNPQEAIAAGGFLFGHTEGGALSTYARSYELETGWFDANMQGYVKIARALRIDTKSMPASHSITVEYRTDDESSYTSAGAAITAAGRKVYPFGTIDAQGVYPGIDFEKMQLKFYINELTTGLHTTPVFKSSVMGFLKVMNPAWSWTLQIDLENTFQDRAPDYMFNKLVALKDSGRFYAIELNDEFVYTARIAGMSSVTGSGTDMRRQCQISVIELREDLGAPFSIFGA